MAKASESALGTLHAAVAEALTDVIANGAVVTDKEGEAVRITAPAAYLGAAIAFLKNNNITADAETNAGLSRLREQLNQRKGKGLTPEVLADAEAEFDRMHGGSLQ